MLDQLCLSQQEVGGCLELGCWAAPVSARLLYINAAQQEEEC